MLFIEIANNTQCYSKEMKCSLLQLACPWLKEKLTNNIINVKI